MNDYPYTQADNFVYVNCNKCGKRFAITDSSWQAHAPDDPEGKNLTCTECGMRSPQEVQRAHDIIHALVNHREEWGFYASPKTAHELEVCLDVYCWVLGHTHNHNMEENLNNLENFMSEHGFELVSPPE